MKKRALILALAGIMAASLIGCGSRKDDAVVVKAGDEEITAGVANFYARYTQAQYETYFASYLGGDDMWSRNASDGKTYEESIKKTLLDDLKNMALLEEHMKDYDVKLTKADKKAINDAAKEFDKANSQKKKDKVSGSKENVKRVMTLMAIEQKMRAAIVADANVKVTDEEATQKHMQYVEFDYSTTSDSSSSSDTTVSEAEKKKTKETAEAFAKGAKTAEDFAAYATEQGTEAKDATFDSDSVSPSKEVVKAADKLGEGETTDVIEGDTACYVAKVTSLNDKTATETKKQSMITDKQDKYYKKVLKKWKKEEKITVHKGSWNKISFTKLSVKAKDTSTTGTGSTSAHYFVITMCSEEAAGGGSVDTIVYKKSCQRQLLKILFHESRYDLVDELAVSFSLYFRHQVLHDLAFILCGRSIQSHLCKNRSNDFFDLCFIHHLRSILFQNSQTLVAFFDDLCTICRSHIQGLFCLLDLF